MKYTKQFIEDAIEGGWNPRPENVKPKLLYSFPTEYDSDIFMLETNFVEDGVENGRNWKLQAEQILLDPKAWQAVGKTRGWFLTFSEAEPDISDEFRRNWHQFIDHLADGKTIEEALSLIEKS